MSIAEKLGEKANENPGSFITNGKSHFFASAFPEPGSLTHSGIARKLHVALQIICSEGKLSVIRNFIFPVHGFILPEE